MLSDSLLLDIDKLEPLSVRRMPIGLIKTGRQFSTADDEKCATRRRLSQKPVENAPIHYRPGEKNEKTQEHSTAARFHRAIKRRRRVNDQGVDCRCGGYCENMLRRIGESLLVIVAVVAADHVKRLADHDQLDHVDQHELKRTHEKYIAPEIADHAVK